MENIIVWLKTRRLKNVVIFIQAIYFLVTYSQVHGCPVLKVVLLQSFWWISATRFAELIQFCQDPKCRRNRTFWTRNVVIYWKRLRFHTYFAPSFTFYFSLFPVYIYIYIYIYIHNIYIYSFLFFLLCAELLLKFWGYILKWIEITIMGAWY